MAAGPKDAKRRQADKRPPTALGGLRNLPLQLRVCSCSFQRSSAYTHLSSFATRELYPEFSKHAFGLKAASLVDFVLVNLGEKDSNDGRRKYEGSPENAKTEAEQLIEALRGE